MFKGVNNSNNQMVTEDTKTSISGWYGCWI